MKKLKKIFLFIIMFTFIFTLSGCGTKKSINVEDFKKIMEKNGYKVVDSTDQYKEKFTLKKWNNIY
jgi:uncharacterized lipoprotein YehR (DUF1307 family)